MLARYIHSDGEQMVARLLTKQHRATRVFRRIDEDGDFVYGENLCNPDEPDAAELLEKTRPLAPRRMSRRESISAVGRRQR